jgi:short-chain fatty acids transporter
MLPVLGLLGLKARDVIGYTVLQLAVLAPIVIGLLWLLGTTIAWHAPVMP